MLLDQQSEKEIEWNGTDVEITQMLLRRSIIADLTEQLQPLMHCQTINIIREQEIQQRA